MGGFIPGWKAAVGIIVLALIAIAISQNVDFIGNLTKRRA